MSEKELVEYTLRALNSNHSEDNPRPQPERPVNPVVFFNMTGDETPLPKCSDLYTLGEMIGTGSFSQVYKAVDKKTKETIAIKSYRMRKRDVAHVSRAVTEMAFMKILHHPNIIAYVLCDITKEYVCLGLEYSAYGSLANFMKRTIGFSESTVQSIMRQIISAVCYLHSMNIFHGDIKPENIIVHNVKDTYLIIKLTDFGLADVIINPNGYLKKAGSFYYMAPEIHLGFPSDHTSDLFSAGVVMYELLFGDKPFSTKISRDVYITNLRRRVEIFYPRFESFLLSENCLSLVKNLLSYDKKERVSGKALAKHPFLTIDLVNDEDNHYLKACESLLKSVEYVSGFEYSLGYMEVTEAILHLKIHLNRIRDDEALCRYTMWKLRDYVKYADMVEDKLVNGRGSELISIPFHYEKLSCLLKSTPILLNGYDICCVGEMYWSQNNMQEGAKKIKEGLNILFPLMVHEPEGFRKQLLTTKMEQWVKILEDITKGTGSEVVPEEK